MILRRYINKEVLTTTLIVLLFLFFVVMFDTLIDTLGKVAEGIIKPGIVLKIVVLKIPEFLELMLPLSFFIGLMLTFGRQYVEHEITVLKSTGISHFRLATMLWPTVVLLFCLQCMTSHVLKPLGNYYEQKIRVTEAINSAFDMLEPKNFISINQYNLHIGNINTKSGVLEDIMLIERGGAKNGNDKVIIAKRAQQVKVSNQVNGNKKNTDKTNNLSLLSQLDLFDGRQYEVSASGQTYSLMQFSRYRLTMKMPGSKEFSDGSSEIKTTLSLLPKIKNPTVLAEVGLRFAMSLSIFMAVILALPLSFVQPRQGRWVRLLPAIVIFASCVLIMSSFKGGIASQQTSVYMYLISLLPYVLLSWYMYNKQIGNKVFLSKFNKKTKVVK